MKRLMFYYAKVYVLKIFVIRPRRVGKFLKHAFRCGTLWSLVWVTRRFVFKSKL